MRKIAVRKIVKARKTASLLKKVIVVDAIFALAGIVLYITLLRYYVILINALLWILEALMFAGVVVAVQVVTSRTLYGARYELLRGESLASLFIAVLAVAVTTYFLVEKVATLIRGGTIETSNPASAIYMFAGSVVSAIIWRYCKQLSRRSRAKLIITKTLAKKQLMDAIMDSVLGASVLAAYAAGALILEIAGLLLVAGYVLKGYFSIVREDVTRLIGVYEPVSIRRKVVYAAKSSGKLRVRKVRLTPMGSFYEAEIWIEAPPTMPLGAAHANAMKVAREVVSKVHEVIRALVIVVPSDYRRQAPRKKSGEGSLLVPALERVSEN